MIHLGRQIFDLCFLLTNLSVCVGNNLYLVRGSMEHRAKKDREEKINLTLSISRER